MVKIKGHREISEEVSLNVEPIGQPVEIRFLEEIVQMAEQDSPAPGMTEERVYAKFLYFLGTEHDFPSKLTLVRNKRIEQGWKAIKNSDNLELDFGDSPYGNYEIKYKEITKKVFVQSA